MRRGKLQVSLTGQHLFVGNTEYDDRERWATIPAGRWEKKLKKWRYPASPFIATRIKWAAQQLSQEIKKDTDFERLLNDMKYIRETAHYCKSKDTMELAARYKDEIFCTVTRPWTHQAVAAEFSRGPRQFAYLAMDMGTGKTMVAINEIYHRKAALVLVVCPKCVIDVWIEELAIHRPSSRRRLLALDNGSSTRKAREVQRFVENARGSTSIIIVNYESFWRGDLGAAFLNNYFDMIVYDEAHKLKSAGSQTSRFAAKMVQRSAFRLALSGTPLPNGVVDAYGQYRALDPGVFGTSVTRFRTRYFILNPHVDFPDIIGMRNENEMKQLLNLTMYRVEKSDVMDLPDTQTVHRYFKLDRDTAKSYLEMENEFVTFVASGKATASNALSKVIRLQQITSGFVKTEDGVESRVGFEKQRLLEEVLLDEVPRGEPVCVFCKFTRDLASVEEVANKLGLRYKELSGARKELEKGKYPENCDVLGIQVQSGGLGVNLTKSAYCIFYSIGYSLSEFLQCRDRLHRGGQTRRILYIHLLAKGTIDEMVYSAILNKKEIVDEILDKIRQTNY